MVTCWLHYSPLQPAAAHYSALQGLAKAFKLSCVFLWFGWGELIWTKLLKELLRPSVLQFFFPIVFLVTLNTAIDMYESNGNMY